MRKWRAKFQHTLESIDDLTLEGQDGEAKSKTKELDKFIIQTLLVELPKMKEKAKKGREEAINDDFASTESTASKRMRYTESAPTELDLMDTHGLPSDFLPSAMTAPKKLETKNRLTNQSKQKAPASEQAPSKKSGKQAASDATAEPAEDTYLNGISDPFHIKVLERFRPQIEGPYRCKDRIIAALNSIKDYYSTRECLEEISRLYDK